jgi:murein DD-endopeptidase MepM/ murein hydrolase activator NlpD
VRRLLLASCLALLVVGAAQSGVSADVPPTDPAQQQAVIDLVRAQLGSNLADAMAAQVQLQQSLEANAAQQADVQSKIAAAQQRIADLTAQIAEAQRREAILAARIDAERAQLRELARAIYSSPSSVLVILGEAKNLGDLLTRAADLNAAGSRAADIKASMKNDLSDLQYERKMEQAAREEQVKLRDQLNIDLTHLKVLQAQQEKSMADLQDKIAETKYELAMLNSQSAELAQKVADMLTAQQNAIIAAAMQSVWAQVQNNVGSIPPSPGHSVTYRFIWPEPTAAISQSFGPSSFPFEPPYGGYAHFHTGIDLVAPFGTPIFAADDGVVALVGSTNSGYGYYVVIAHSGGLDTLYGHLSTTLVKIGDPVTQGQTVGLEGSTGNSTGPHLHFELRISQRPIDPAPYLPPGAPSAFKG